MPVLYYAIQESTLTFAPDTPLIKIVIFWEDIIKNTGSEDKSFPALDSGSWESYSTQVEANARRLIPLSNSLSIGEEPPKSQALLPVDCVFIVEKSQLLGILTLTDLKHLIASKINLATVTIAEVMREPIITLPENFDINTTMQIVRQYGLYHLPIIDDMNILLGIVTPDSITAGLQKELSNTSKQLEREIAQRRSLELALKEKETLLTEIHHRVKNNLQIISSLLRLKARHISDEQAIDIFQDSQNRVQAMAMIHESMSKSHNLASIKFADYVHNLTNNLLTSYGVTPNIKIHLNIEQLFLNINTVVHCGLIINELICNAIKHAFLYRDTGNIYVNFRRFEYNKYLLDVSDDGVGFPQGLEVLRNQSIGLQIVWSLVEQLEGTIAFNSNKLGTVFTIKFVMQN
ncbi:histidine kinase dimerization/phosphoacceptor domain -containing protein [Dendronalium sp. ChiSLP03b]|uniref:histidine kinase dimerization/phosphoacceptor domain -containing protein n=1 Tax=Dendronalium sp. ChiSLP03b TaxID=3075381 RepID=UPI00391BF4DA